MWRTVECVVQGRGHIKTEVLCQDKTYACNHNGVHAVALADGAGSARLSHYGAECITQYVCEQLCNRFDAIFNENDGTLVKKTIIFEILQQLNVLSNALDCNVNDLASTLLFVAVKENCFILAHIGDGVIGYLEGEELKVASHPENGEFVNTTIFTTSNNALAAMKMIKGNIGQIRGFLLMSDGTAEGLYDKRTKSLAHPIKKVMDSCTYLPSDTVQRQLQYSFEKTISQVTMDDCSIAILVNERNDFSGYCNMNLSEKCNLLRLNTKSKYLKKQIRKYDSILLALQDSKRLAQIARIIHLKPKYIKKYIDQLLIVNLIEQDKCGYRTIIKL